MFGQTITNYQNTPIVVCHSRSPIIFIDRLLSSVIDSDCGIIILELICDVVNVKETIIV